MRMAMLFLDRNTHAVNLHSHCIILVSTGFLVLLHLLLCDLQIWAANGRMLIIIEKLAQSLFINQITFALLDHPDSHRCISCDCGQFALTFNVYDTISSLNKCQTKAYIKFHFKSHTHIYFHSIHYWSNLETNLNHGWNTVLLWSSQPVKYTA